MNSTYTQLINNLEYLKMIAHLNEVIDFTTKNKLSFVDALIKLTAHEIHYKESNMIKSIIKVGAFPHQKNLSILTLIFNLALIRIKY
ncbi:IstB ATP binding domain-containing protein [Clostridium sp. DL-VIII]|uniref:hypothetical protein n=1 Tax=Clostridium sp. DL-VIII TaxID=641107 RepID=UPI00023AF1A6|nr:hypothetical protein [Clostridium sp. DL-VIII]EHI97617.1 IstB ATP binding domain-containing protein [Clostridium sp. DL-VIII]